MLNLGLNLGEVTHARNKGGGFDLNAWMAAQLGGFDFDYTKTDRNFQEVNGPTPVSAVDHLIRLSLSDRLWGGRTLEQYLTTQPEFRGSGVTGTAGTAPAAATYNTSTGVGTAARTDNANKSFVSFGGLSSARTYACDIENTGAVSLTLRTSVGGSLVSQVSAGQRVVVFGSPLVDTLAIEPVTNSTSIAFTVHSLKEVSRAAATQATGSLAPKWGPTLGAKWDGVDDRQLTTIPPSAGNNLLIVKAALPAVWTTLRVLVGARGASDTRFYIGFDSNSIGGGLGAQGPAVIRPSGPPDLRGQTIVAGLANNGSTVRLFLGGEKVYEAAQSGSVNTSVPCAIGGFNDNGVPGFFFDGSISRASLFHTTEFVDTDLFRRIAASY